MHSSGASSGSVAANGLSKTERAASGKDGRVIGLVCIAAQLTHKGVSLKDYLEESSEIGSSSMSVPFPCCLFQCPNLSVY
jgi:hypothetical protein